ncbi:MAG: glycosyltransferase family 4 protein [Phormidesmis sp.]
MSLRLLFLSTPVGPLGSGLGGGLEFTVTYLAKELAKRGHRVTVAAPSFSALPFQHKNVDVVQIPGDWQTTAQSQKRSAPMVTSSALAGLWDYGRQMQACYDLLVNFAYDWLPFYLTPFFTTPIAHFVSMGSLTNAMDQAVETMAFQYPHALGAYTQAQAATFPHTAAKDWTILSGGLDIDHYQYCEKPNGFLGWVGRISPEKGLEDAIRASVLSQKPLKIFGKIEDIDYWAEIQQQITQSAADVEYRGFVSRDELQQRLGKAQALLMTPRWIEAFGIVAIEALACGVPVIAYARGGPTEIIQDGKTGWLVQPDSVDGLCEAIAHITDIDRRQCRKQAEAKYSLSAWGDRFEQWFYQRLSSTISS